jgi:hypothetical protein
MRHEKYNSLLIQILFLFAVTVVEAGNLTNRVAMYVITNKVPRDALVNGTVKVGEMTFAPRAVLSDGDFVAYDTTNHVLTVSADGAKLIAKAMMRREAPSVTGSGVVGYHLDGPDTPFVLVVSGQPIYVGIFSSPISSTMYSLPVIWPSLPFVREDSTNPVRLRIRFQKLQNDNAQSLPDPRDDPRFLSAVKGLGL